MEILEIFSKEFLMQVANYFRISIDEVEEDYYYYYLIKKISINSGVVFKGSCIFYKLFRNFKRRPNDLDFDYYNNISEKEKINVVRDIINCDKKIILKDNALSVAQYGEFSYRNVNDESKKIKIECLLKAQKNVNPIKIFIGNYIYRYMNKHNIINLSMLSSVVPVLVKTYPMEQMFTDKLLSLSYLIYLGEKGERRKYELLRDICQLSTEPTINSFINNKISFRKCIFSKLIEDSEFQKNYFGLYIHSSFYLKKDWMKKYINEKTKENFKTNIGSEYNFSNVISAYSKLNKILKEATIINYLKHNNNLTFNNFNNDS